MSGPQRYTENLVRLCLKVGRGLGFSETQRLRDSSGDSETRGLRDSGTRGLGDSGAGDSDIFSLYIYTRYIHIIYIYSLYSPR